MDKADCFEVYGAIIEQLWEGLPLTEVAPARPRKRKPRVTDAVLGRAERCDYDVVQSPDGTITYRKREEVEDTAADETYWDKKVPTNAAH